MKTKVLILLLICTSCLKKNGYMIKGNIKNLKDSTKVFLFDYKELKVLDSCFSLNEEFKFIGKTKEPLLSGVSFMIAKNNFNIDFWLENDNIIITKNSKKELNNSIFKVTGGELNKISNLFKESLKDHKKNKTEAYLRFKKKEITREEYDKIIDKFNIAALNFFNKYPNNYFSISEVISNKIYYSKKELSSFYKLLNNQLKKTDKGKLLEKYIKTEKINLGDKIINIEASDIKGNKVNLSQIKDSIILLNFWASWCPPCIEKIKNEFPSIQQKYPNIKLVSFSFDLDKKMWKKKSEDLNIDWVNLSNFKTIGESITAINYNIEEIPTTFLIKHGKIKKIIRYNDDLLSEIELGIKN